MRNNAQRRISTRRRRAPLSHRSQRLGATTFAQLTRQEFEDWLDSIGFRNKWKIKDATGGIYQLYLSPFVAIEINSTTGSREEVRGRGAASMKLKLVSRMTGKVLNRKAQGQKYFARTTNWRKNWKKGVDRMNTAYLNSAGFYDAKAQEENEGEYKADTLTKIESVQGWEGQEFLSDLHAKVEKGKYLTQNQMAALDKWVSNAKSRAQREEAEPSPSGGDYKTETLAKIESYSGWENLKILSDFHRLVSRGIELSPNQERALDKFVSKQRTERQEPVSQSGNYKEETLAKIESIPGWEDNKYLPSFRNQVLRGRVLSDKQVWVLERELAKARLTLPSRSQESDQEPEPEKGPSVGDRLWDDSTELMAQATERRDMPTLGWVNKLRAQLSRGEEPTLGDIVRVKSLLQEYAATPFEEEAPKAPPGVDISVVEGKLDALFGQATNRGRQDVLKWVQAVKKKIKDGVMVTRKEVDTINQFLKNWAVTPPKKKIDMKLLEDLRALYDIVRAAKNLGLLKWVAAIGKKVKNGESLTPQESARLSDLFAEHISGKGPTPSEEGPTPSEGILDDMQKARQFILDLRRIPGRTSRTTDLYSDWLKDKIRYLQEGGQPDAKMRKDFSNILESLRDQGMSSTPTPTSPPAPEPPAVPEPEPSATRDTSKDQPKLDELKELYLAVQPTNNPNILKWIAAAAKKIKAGRPLSPADVQKFDDFWGRFLFGEGATETSPEEATRGPQGNWTPNDIRDLIDQAAEKGDSWTRDFATDILNKVENGYDLKKRQREVLEKKLIAYGLLAAGDAVEDDTLKRMRDLWLAVRDTGDRKLADRVRDLGERYKQLGNFTTAQERTVQGLFKKFRVASPRPMRLSGLLARYHTSR